MKHIFSTLLICLCLVSTEKASAQSTLTPIQFNDELVIFTEKLYAYGQEWGRAFNSAYQSGDWTGLTPHRETIDKFLNESLAKLRTMKDVGGSYALRTQMIRFMEFEKNQSRDVFLPFESFTAKTSKEEISAAYEKLTNTGEAAELAKVNKEQEDYAKANGFRIESAEEAETPGE